MVRCHPDPLVEVLDLIIDVDASARRPVHRDVVLGRCSEAGDRWAMRLVSSLPSHDGWLDPAAVDDLLVGVHGEIDRLSWVTRHGARMQAVLGPMIDGLRAAGHPPPYRIVDHGCGTGYLLRWLAARGLPDDVEVIGIDTNPTVVAEATRLAVTGGLDCTFRVGDALQPDHEATIVVSTALLHHLSERELEDYFAAQSAGSAAAFVHADLRPGPVTVLGITLVHFLLMRLAVSRHDGIRSAQRAHPLPRLVDASRSGAEDFTLVSAGLHGWDPIAPMLTVLAGVRTLEAGRLAGAGSGQRRQQDRQRTTDGSSVAADP